MTKKKGTRHRSDAEPGPFEVMVHRTVTVWALIDTVAGSLHRRGVRGQKKRDP